MSVEHGTPFSAGDEESLRQFLDSLEVPSESLEKQKKFLRRRGLIALSSARMEFGHEDDLDPGLIPEMQAFIGTQLNAYNMEQGFLRPGDKITANGNLYARLTLPGDMTLEAPFRPHYQLTGEFAELISMPAPPQEKLTEDHPGAHIYGRHNFMSGIRLEYPLITETIGEFTEPQYYPVASVLDLPLYVSEMDLQRIYE